MNLTEPHAGTDLGLLRTRAEPQDDGSYRITGQKIFISAGDHDLADNIVHLVLARIPGAPGRRQGHLALHRPEVPRRTPTAASATATPSPCGKLEEKMGIHGNATCVMNYDGATGYLIGEPHRGLAGDVHHDERGAASASASRASPRPTAAYQLAAAYARERLQGRAVAGAANPDAAGRPADRPPRRAADADGPEGLRRGRPRLPLWAATLIDAHDRAGDADGARRWSRC